MIDEKLITLNRQQEISETDTFTEQRYEFFYSWFRDTDRDVLDLGCNTGRGGSVLKHIDSNLKIYGADIVTERLGNLPENVLIKRLIFLKRSCKKIIIVTM